jgi:hypothetical protein
MRARPCFRLFMMYVNSEVLLPISLFLHACMNATWSNRHLNVLKGIFLSLSLFYTFVETLSARATCVRHSCDLLFGKSFLMASCWLAWCLCFPSSDRSFRDFATESRLWPALSLFFPSEVKSPVSPCFRSLGLEFSCFSIRDFLALFMLILFQASSSVGTLEHSVCRFAFCDLPCYVHLECSEAVLYFGTRCLMYLLYLLRDLKSLQVRFFLSFLVFFLIPVSSTEWTLQLSATCSWTTGRSIR